MVIKSKREIGVVAQILRRRRITDEKKLSIEKLIDDMEKMRLEVRRCFARRELASRSYDGKAWTNEADHEAYLRLCRETALAREDQRLANLAHA